LRAIDLKNGTKLLWKKIFSGWKSRKQIIFIHLPKCAGSTINWHIKNHLKKDFWSTFVKINEVFLNDPSSLIKKAREADYVYGHMSIELAKHVGKEGNPFIFTFLRAPEDRLLSLYNYTRNLSIAKLEKAVGDKILASKIQEMSQVDFFSSNDPRLRFDLDNYYVRCFSGSLFVFPDTEAEWMNALEVAQNNLLKLDFIGLQASFNEHLKTLFTKLEISLPDSMPKRNVTSQLNEVDESKFSTEISEEARALVDQLIKYDRMLYEWVEASK
jgi:hypothetical protein